MARPIWKGFITFGLVNIPVILYPAEKRQDIQFKMVDSRDKAKIHYKRINEETGKEVPWSDVAKGYEYEDNNFIIIKEEDIKAISGEHSKTIEIDSFIDIDSLDYVYFDKPYYLVPDKKGDKGYVILRETLKDTKKIGIAKVIIHTREYLAALMPYENALVLNLLRYDQELRKIADLDLPKGNLKTYKINTKELEIAKQLVASMTTKWHPETYHDVFRETLRKWIDEKIEHIGEKPSRKKAKNEPIRTPKANVINFVDLLKKSLEQQKPKKHSAAKKRKS